MPPTFIAIHHHTTRVLCTIGKERYQFGIKPRETTEIRVQGESMEGGRHVLFYKVKSVMANEEPLLSRLQSNDFIEYYPVFARNHTSRFVKLQEYVRDNGEGNMLRIQEKLRQPEFFAIPIMGDGAQSRLTIQLLSYKTHMPAYFKLSLLKMESCATLQKVMRTIKTIGDVKS